MREIKFRIFNKHGQNMIYDTAMAMRDMSDNGFKTEDEHRYIMQYAGLEDKNGIPIYEGDILKYPYTNYGVDLLEVAYKEEEACFIGRYPSHIGDYEMLNDSDFKVIGNVFENPELLEV